MMAYQELLHTPTYLFLVYLFLEMRSIKESVKKIEGNINSLIQPKS